MATVEQYIARAAAQIGNNGTQYNMWYWGYIQPAWCAAFQSWVAAGLGMTEFKSAACSTIYAQVKHKVGTRSVANVQRGDLVFFNWDNRSDTSWMDHIGVVEWVDRNTGVFGTIEGNTDGGLCLRKTRTIYGGYFTCFARPVYDEPTPPPPPPAPEPPAPPTEGFAVGDIVVPTRLVNYNGYPLTQYHPQYRITEINADRAVLSPDGTRIWAAMNTADIRKVGSAPEPEAVTYTVVKGDTLWDIANKYNTTWQKLAELNGLSEDQARKIYPGQVIRIK